MSVASHVERLGRRVYDLRRLAVSRSDHARGRYLAHLLSRLGYAFYLVFVAPLVAFLPAPAAYHIACFVGDWRYQNDDLRRKTIIRNLRDVLGDQLSPADRANVARDFFRRDACQALDKMRLIGKGRALMRLVEIRGLEHLEAALAAGKGAIICTAHFGLFGGAYSLLGACGFPITAVGNWDSTDDPDMALLHRLILWLVHKRPLAHHRRRPEIEPGKVGVLAAVHIVEVLRANEVIAMPIDSPIMDPKDLARAVPVDFLGRQARLLPGSAMIAKRTGAPTLTAVMRRSTNWRRQILEISPPTAVGKDPVTAFKSCLAVVEAPIRENPAHWDFWQERQVLVNLGLAPGEVVKDPRRF